jgi:glutaredoxin
MRLPLSLVLGLTIGVAGPALAQYKVVGPDGKVTYTDRPVAPPAGGQVQPMRAGTAAASAAAPLPLELRNVAARFPVTLYTSPDCPPCDSGRQLLQHRGVPFVERVVSSDDDTAALQRITNGRTVPSLTVGGQALRGFLDTDWQTTLDLAGYPKESKLPRGWSAGPATPLVARAPAPDAAAQPARPAPAAAADTPLVPAGGIRF